MVGKAKANGALVCWWSRPPVTIISFNLLLNAAVIVAFEDTMVRREVQRTTNATQHDIGNGSCCAVGDSLAVRPSKNPTSQEIVLLCPLCPSSHSLTCPLRDLSFFLRLSHFFLLNIELSEVQRNYNHSCQAPDLKNLLFVLWEKTPICSPGIKPVSSLQSLPRRGLVFIWISFRPPTKPPPWPRASSGSTAPQCPWPSLGARANASATTGARGRPARGGGSGPCLVTARSSPVTLSGGGGSVFCN